MAAKLPPPHPTSHLPLLQNYTHGEFMIKAFSKK